MKKSICFVLIALFFSLLKGHAQNLTNVKNHLSKYYTKAMLEEDLDTLVACMERYHPSLFAFQTMEEWENSQMKVRNALKDSMTALHAYSIYSSLIHKIKCGHTAVYPSENLSMWYPHYFKELPVELHFLNDSIYVYDSKSTQIPKGSVITKLGNYTSDQIISRLDTIILNRDGNREDVFNFMFSSTLFITLFADLENEKYNIEYRDYKTKQIKTDSIALKYFFIQNEEESVEDYFSYKVKENKTAVLKIKTFQTSHLKELTPTWQRFFCRSLKRRIKCVFKQIEEDDIEHLIIDIRENEGGDPYLSYQICSYVLSEYFQYFRYFSMNKNLPKKFYTKNIILVQNDSIDTKYFYDKSRDHTYHLQKAKNIYRNQLYVLIDDGTYSTGVQLASILKYHKRAKIIGQTTGGIANYCNAYQFVEYILPNTRTNGIIPIFKVPLAVNLSDKQGVVPDYTVSSTIHDIVEGNDAQLDFTLKLIRQQDY